MNQYLVHPLSPVTDNCSTGENGRRKDFMTNLHVRILPDVRQMEAIYPKLDIRRSNSLGDTMQNTLIV